MNVVSCHEPKLNIRPKAILPDSDHSLHTRSRGQIWGDKQLPQKEGADQFRKPGPFSLGHEQITTDTTEAGAWALFPSFGFVAGSEVATWSERGEGLNPETVTC